MMRRMRTRRYPECAEIAGDYQLRALTEGFVVQRFWHHLKLTIIDRLAKPGPAMEVLDVGCGSGVVADHLARTARRVLAIDTNRDAIRFASAHFVRRNLEFRVADALGLSLGEESFDGIYLLELVEHFPWPHVEALTQTLACSLKPGGFLFLTTPNYRSLWPLVERTIDRLGLAPTLAGHQHISRPTIRLLRGLGLRASLRELHLGRVSGLAPFASVLGWRLATWVDAIERRCGCPCGNLLVGLWRKE
jgi:SAM-dependent methyltransferase